MKLFIAGLALAIAISSPAFGLTKSKQARDKAEPKSWETGYTQQRRPAHAPNPAWDVYRGNGEYAGSDPDPHVRAMLRRDQPNGD